jgi:hypothetical protein
LVGFELSSGLGTLLNGRQRYCRVQNQIFGGEAARKNIARCEASGPVPINKRCTEGAEDS